MKIKIKNSELFNILIGDLVDYPKYTSQIINLANQNAQGTRPKAVGQMSELIKEFDGKTIDEWKNWYYKKYPNAIDDAVEKIYPMLEKLNSALDKIDKELVRAWVEDLVINKTFIGLKYQDAILKKVADAKSEEYFLSTPQDEAKGIDGYIGNRPVSVKPSMYNTKDSLNELIEVDIIYYDKKKDGITVNFNF